MAAIKAASLTSSFYLTDFRFVFPDFFVPPFVLGL